MIGSVIRTASASTLAAKYWDLLSLHSYRSPYILNNRFNLQSCYMYWRDNLRRIWNSNRLHFTLDIAIGTATQIISKITFVGSKWKACSVATSITKSHLDWNKCRNECYDNLRHLWIIDGELRGCCIHDDMPHRRLARCSIRCLGKLGCTGCGELARNLKFLIIIN